MDKLSHTHLIKKCHIATSMSNSPKCGVDAKSKSHVMKKITWPNPIKFLFFCHPGKIATICIFEKSQCCNCQNCKKSHWKITTKRWCLSIVAIVLNISSIVYICSLWEKKNLFYKKESFCNLFCDTFYLLHTSFLTHQFFFVGLGEKTFLNYFFNFFLYSNLLLCFCVF